ncbi:Hsp20/alpha crystallin family protein [Salinarimonas rosea]|uniref:Hsp20/alpha crystallin family protein n=1 Tax=Salinarimonas rosea TaxID=552063 RepID=UPI00048B1314|nr:Hsp20/alpha crystallin family protein [Salinarimonas rosea]
MKVRGLIPWGRGQERSALATMRDRDDPFAMLHREIDRLFENAFGSLDGGVPMRSLGTAWPALEVSETDGGLKVVAELPGLEEKDVDVTLDGDVLTVRGERRETVEDKDRRFSERWYGAFERRIPLPYKVDEERVEAAFDNGLLSVTLPRSAEAEEHRRRIPVNGSKQKAA